MHTVSCPITPGTGGLDTGYGKGNRWHLKGRWDLTGYSVERALTVCETEGEGAHKRNQESSTTQVCWEASDWELLSSVGWFLLGKFGNTRVEPFQTLVTFLPSSRCFPHFGQLPMYVLSSLKVDDSEVKKLVWGVLTGRPRFLFLERG